LKIHETALISKDAQIGKNVEIGAFTIVNAGVSIGDDSTVGAFCELGVPSTNSLLPFLELGPGSLIRSHSVFYNGSKFGEQLMTGHRVTVRENTVAGSNLQIGTLSDIQGDCSIGSYVRFHSSVHVGKGSRIEDYVWVFPYVVLTNDPHPPSEVRLGVVLQAYAVIATHSTILPGVVVGRGALVGAHSLVAKDVAENTVVAGVPAKYKCETSSLLLRDGSDRSAYPWRKHFNRGYPIDLVTKWLNEAT
jgi:acetyltransferase-like isoleucine patch superfamily enzyme